MIRLTPFTTSFLDRSWAWLRDSEIKSLTMTPDFDRESQQRFFESLPDRHDYRIWGVTLVDGRPIGAAGLKHIDGRKAEYWGYIGEKDCWGQGLGGHLLGAIENQARSLGVRSLTLTVTAQNHRAVTLYRRSGFVATDPRADPLLMTKELAP